MTDDLPNDGHGPGNNAGNIIREFRRRLGRQSGQPEDELPAFRDVLEDVGFEFHELAHNTETDHLTIRYSPPADVESVAREVELLVCALKAAHRSERWADGGVDANSARGSWQLDRQEVRRWPEDPHLLVERATASLTQ